ncbi:MAG: hypothetical protein CAF41_005615 [Nitrospira sp. CG24A]|nr:MAG: hypothetical protein CAF41_005615 [Nitrospira sp. CG24A]
MPWNNSMGLLQIPGFLLTLAMGIVLVADTIALLKGFVGSLAYGLWIFVVPVLAPVALLLPWFDAWVFGTAVNPMVFWIWVAWLVPLGILVIVVGLPELIRRFKS